MGEEELDGLFAEARAAAPLPSAALIQRIEAAGLAEQARQTAPKPAGRVRRRALPSLAGWFGGIGLTAGLASVTMAGIWLGAVQPAGLTAVTDSVSQVFGISASMDRVDLIPTIDPFVAEG